LKIDLTQSLSSDQDCFHHIDVNW